MEGRTATRCSQRGGYCDPYELIRIKFESLAMRLGDLRTSTMASCAIRSGSLRHLTLRATPSRETGHLLWRAAFEFPPFSLSSADRTLKLPDKSYDLVIPKLAMQNPIRKYILGWKDLQCVFDILANSKTTASCKCSVA